MQIEKIVDVAFPCKSLYEQLYNDMKEQFRYYHHLLLLICMNMHSIAFNNILKIHGHIQVHMKKLHDWLPQFYLLDHLQITLKFQNQIWLQNSRSSNPPKSHLKETSAIDTTLQGL
jgi:hypothetical protein